MSRVDDLITELAPEGVPFKALGDVGELIRGSGLRKSDLTDKGAPAIHYGQVHTTYGTWAMKTVSFVDPDFAKTLRRAVPGDLVLATTSEDDEAVAKAVAWLGDEDAAISGDAYIYRHTLDPKYVAYYFQSDQFQDQKWRSITGTKVRRISGDALARIRIPVPPIEVQREIARVLDSLTSLEEKLVADLEAELKARREQYAYYRDTQFAAKDLSGLKLLPLSELGQFVRGRRFTKSDVVEDGIPSIHYGEIYTTYGIATTSAASKVRRDLGPRLRYAKPGDVVIAAVGETVEDVGKGVAWLGTTEVAIHDDCFLYRSPSLDPKYVSYYLRTTNLIRAKDKYVSRAKVKRMSSNGLGRLEIPVLPIEEQRRVVAVLDKYGALLDELATSIPAEVAARRKQYEYYRNRLLTFKELAA